MGIAKKEDSFETEDLKEELEGVLAVAKNIVAQQGDTSPTFLIDDGEQLIVANMPFDDSTRDLAKEAITKLVTGANSTRYFFVCTAWTVDGEDAKKKAAKKLAYLVKLSEKDAKKQMQKEEVITMVKAYAGVLRPSESPFRKEVLIVSRFDKAKGSDAIMVELKRTQKNKKEIVSFGKHHPLSGTMYSRFNIWNEYQVDLDDAMEKKKCTIKECVDEKKKG
jgi:hypothetical protein